MVQITAGEDHACALLASGPLRCWGDATFGQIGSGNTVRIGDDEAPATVSRVQTGGRVKQVTAGRFHTCVVLDKGAVRCWGDGSHGQLGYADTLRLGDDEYPTAAGYVRVGAPVRQVAAGGRHTCALLESGDVRCWGAGAHGQLGYGNTHSIGDDEHPVAAGNVRLGGKALEIAAGNAHTCALLDTGGVRCWGRGFYGQLGYANVRNIGDDEHPSSMAPVRLEARAIAISAGRNHSCALLDGGRLRCWGSGFHGQLGYGNTAAVGNNDHPADHPAIVFSEPLVKITAGGAHTCGLLASGKLRCWGLLWAGWPRARKAYDPGGNEAPKLSEDRGFPVRERFPTEAGLIFHFPTGF